MSFPKLFVESCLVTGSCGCRKMHSEILGLLLYSISLLTLLVFIPAVVVPHAQGQNGVDTWRLLPRTGTSLDGQSKESSACTLGHMVELKNRGKWLLCGQKLTLNVVNW